MTAARQPNPGQTPGQRTAGLVIIGGFIASVVLGLFGLIIYTITESSYDLDELAPRIEQQLDDTYAEDVVVAPVSSGTGRTVSRRLIYIVDGEQVDCQVFNLKEMSDDPDLAPDFRCTEPWPELTPEPSVGQSKTEGS